VVVTGERWFFKTAKPFGAVCEFHQWPKARGKGVGRGPTGLQHNVDEGSLFGDCFWAGRNVRKSALNVTAGGLASSSDREQCRKHIRAVSSSDRDPKMVYRGGCGSVSNDERASPSGTMIGSRSA
jgi:hypothetical protein